jgi:hypothetical protein
MPRTALDIGAEEKTSTRATRYDSARGGGATAGGGGRRQLPESAPRSPPAAAPPPPPPRARRPAIHAAQPGGTEIGGRARDREAVEQDLRGRRRGEETQTS